MIVLAGDCRSWHGGVLIDSIKDQKGYPQDPAGLDGELIYRLLLPS